MSTTGGQPVKIAVLGAGTWGIALARVLSLNGHRITVWSKFPDEAKQLDARREAPNLPGTEIPGEIVFTADPQEAAEGAEYLLMVLVTLVFAFPLGLLQDEDLKITQRQRSL